MFDAGLLLAVMILLVCTNDISLHVTHPMCGPNRDGKTVNCQYFNLREGERKRN